MSIQTFRSIGEAARAIERDMAARERRLQIAIRKTARQTRNAAVRSVPRAFGELADSIEAEDIAPGHSDVVADAPHAAAVEVGSRPHMPPLAPLIAWVELRGMQGLTAKGNVKSNRIRGVHFLVKDPRKEAARNIAQQLRSRLGRSGASAWRARASQGPLAQRETGHDPATVAIARAIQMKIARSGTKPRRYMQATIPEALDALALFVGEALPDK